MKPADRNPIRVILYEGAGSQPLEPGRRLDLLTTLLQHGYAVKCTGQSPHASVKPPVVLLVLGQFDGQPPPSHDAGGNELTVLFRDISDHAPQQTLDMVESVHTEADLPKPRPWKPWFPVIDYDRCTNCMQCLSFCLFDVYGTTPEGKIQVQNQNKCKTDCPACSRVCPEVAILFPKYTSGPINGAEVSEEDLKRESMKVDISALLGGDIYQALRQRSTSAKERFARERDEKRALNERRRCLKKLQEKLDIPDEVIAALPSIDQIQAKAELAVTAAQEPQS